MTCSTQNENERQWWDGLGTGDGPAQAIARKLATKQDRKCTQCAPCAVILLIMADIPNLPKVPAGLRPILTQPGNMVRCYRSQSVNQRTY
jgi:hypothetical protein